MQYQHAYSNWFVSTLLSQHKTTFGGSQLLKSCSQDQYSNPEIPKSRSLSKTINPFYNFDQATRSNSRKSCPWRSAINYSVRVLTRQEGCLHIKRREAPISSRCKTAHRMKCQLRSCGSICLPPGPLHLDQHVQELLTLTQQ